MATRRILDRETTGLGAFHPLFRGSLIPVADIFRYPRAIHLGAAYRYWDAGQGHRSKWLLIQRR